MGKVGIPARATLSKARAPVARRYIKGRPVYTPEEAIAKEVEFLYPPEPEWEAEWRRRKAQSEMDCQSIQ